MRGWSRWQDVVGIRRRSGSARCGWSLSTRVSTSLSGRRSSRSPSKLGMTSETLRKWVRQAEIDGGARPGVSSAEAERVKELERESQRASAGERDPEGGVGFLRAGARPATAEAMSVFIDEHRSVFGVEPICKLLQVAPSTYYAVKARQQNPAARTLRDRETLAEIQRVHDASAGLYGARKVWWQLQADGIAVARCTVERLMRQAGLAGVVRGRRWRTTIPDDAADRPQDLVGRDFTATAPNQLWVADFTYVATWSGVVYVAFVIDVFSRRIVGWKADTNMRTGLVLGHVGDGALEPRPRRAARRHGAHPSSRQRQSVPQLCLHPAPDRRRRRRVRRLGRRCVRQRARRDDDRSVQDREDLPRRPVEDALRRRAGRAGMGRLVQHDAACILPAADSRLRSSSAGI